MPLLLISGGSAISANKFNDIYVATFLIFLAVGSCGFYDIEENSGIDRLSMHLSVPSLIGRREMAYLMTLAIEDGALKSLYRSI